MEFGVLGPLLVAVHGRVVPVTAGRQRSVLAALLLRPNQVVSIPRLVEAVWGERPPPSAHGLVQTYVWRLRGLLATAGQEEGRLVVGRSGYLLRVDPGELDSAEFERLLELGRTTLAYGHHAEAAQTLSTALGLWRGEPAEDVLLHGDCRSMLQWLAEQRTSALEERIDADLRLGRHEIVVGELRRRAAEHPLREKLSGQLMLALYRCGRQAEAIGAFQALRVKLTEELGIYPSPELRGLHESILRADAALTVPPGRSVTGGGVVPRQLPAAVPHFTGRHAELESLRALERRSAIDPRPGSVLALDGTAGVGKTALALHWAHQIADKYPDGQLYVNLHGFDPGGPPLPVGRAIRGFLAAFQLPDAQIPADLNGQAALYRSVLATKRVLVLLDNARDTGQVGLLLPGGPSCLVIVTSRNLLTGLVAAHGAHPVTIGLFTAPEARKLMERRLGARRVGAEPEASDRLVELCSRLPLALNIVAARAAARPHLRLAALATRLDDVRNRLDLLATEDQYSSTRAAFSCSYESLSAPAARMFRLLGLHHGPDISEAAAAEFAGLDLVSARAALDELTGANLLCESPPDRFAFHDLLRAYAADKTEAVDPAPERERALGRGLEHYLQIVRSASLLLNPASGLLLHSPAEHTVTADKPNDSAQATAWFDAERHVLAACIDHAADAGLGSYSWQLAHGMITYLDRRCFWAELSAAGHVAMDAAQGLRDPTGQACAHRVLARACLRTGALDEAHRRLSTALEIFLDCGHQVGQARVQHDLALVCEQQGRYEEALRHAQQTLNLLQAEGDLAGAANTFNTVGWFHTLLGDHRQALTYCRRALTLQQQLDNEAAQADSWDSLGHAHQQLDEHRHAVDCYLQAVRLYRKIGNCYYEAGSLIRLGDTYRDAGDADAAVDHWRQALALLEDLRHPDAELVQAKLRDVTE